MPRAVKEGDRVTLSGTVTLVRDAGNEVLVTVQLAGATVPVTVPKSFVRKSG